MMSKTLKLSTLTFFSTGTCLALWSKYFKDTVYAEIEEEPTPNDIQQTSFVEHEESKKRIAIIGSGIGGCSAAYYLRELLGPSAIIDIYEKDSKVGGRLSVLELDGHEVECGGSIIHESNKHMVHFTEVLKLERFDGHELPCKLGIWNGDEFVFMKSSGFLSKIRMIWRFGAFSLWNFDTSLTKVINDFSNIYELQNQGNAYRTVSAMLRSMGGDEFIKLTQTTAERYMTDVGIGERLIHELISPITRCNYGQDVKVNAFTGYVSMAGAQSGSLFSVKGGNWRVCEKLLDRSNVTLFLNQHIKSINKVKENGRYVYHLNKAEQDSLLSKPYDVVIVATPLEVPGSKLQCDSCQSWPNQNTGKYQKTVATFLRAYINYKHFGCTTAEDAPTAIFTTENPDLQYSTIGMQHNVQGKRWKHPPLYKVFSREKLSNETVKEIFDLKDDTKSISISWLAYPHYTPPEMFIPFVLDDAVFYVNAIERAASCMEMSAIGGKNTALLARQYLNNASSEL